MRRAGLLTLQAFLGPIVPSTLILSGLGLGLTASALAMKAQVLPGPERLPLLGLLLLPSVLALVLPLALLTAWMTALRRWQEEGVWTALRAVGLRGRRLLPVALSTGIVAALLTALCTHVLAPEGRRAAARRLAESVQPARLTPGRFMALGDLELHVSEDGSVFFHQESPSLAGSASGAALVTRGGVLGLRLDAGRAIFAAPGATGDANEAPVARFGEAWFPISGPSMVRRVELDERSDADLLRLARRREAAGRDASYERTLLYKRTTHALECLLLPLLALPLGLARRGRPYEILVVVVGWWALLRLGDRLCPILGPGLASALPLLGLLLAVGVLWATWRDP